MKERLHSSCLCCLLHWQEWDSVLAATASMRLPTAKTQELYEQVTPAAATPPATQPAHSLTCPLPLLQIVTELVELHDVDAARAMLRGSPVGSQQRGKKPRQQQPSAVRCPDPFAAALSWLRRCSR